LKLFFKVLCVFGIFSLGTAQELQLKIVGNDSVETNLINSIGYLKTFENFEDLQTEVSVFENKLYQLGYIEMQILEISQNPPLTLIKTALGPKYESIRLYADKTLFEFLELEGVKNLKSNPYYLIEFAELETLLNSLTKFLSAKSYPFASVTLKAITPIGKSKLKADLVVETKQARQLQSVKIKGYEKFPRSFIKHFLNIKTNTLFDLKAIQSKTKALNQLPFSKQIRPAEVLFTKDTTRVYLYLEKIKSNRFDGFLGFGSDENSGDLQLNGYLNLNLTNNLNFGESFRVNYRSDENDLKTFETQLTLPYLFKTPIGSEFELNIIKKDSTFTSSEQAANVFYQLNPKQKVFLGIRSTQSNALVTENTTDILDYQTSTYEVKYTYQHLTTQNPLSPLTTALEFRLSKANRKTTDTQTNQILYLLKASKLFSLNQKNSFYLRIQAQGIDSDSYLLNELIRFGGINSIRGFEENSINATNLGVLASEYRYQLSPTLYIHSIIDAAYFETPLQSNNKLYGFGFGFGLLTDAGLLKFNLANGQTENQNFRFSDSKIHLSLTATF
jgi:outer membrane protein assembly factor BamA